MKQIINSRPYGEVEIDEKQILTFPQGILGFENLHRFALMDAQQPPFYWLQSLEVTEIAFVLINPQIFRPRYDPGLTTDELDEIGLASLEEALIFTIVTIPENHREMTANLQGPILVNRVTRVGRQFISPRNEWHVRHKVLEELAAARSAPC